MSLIKLLANRAVDKVLSIVPTIVPSIVAPPAPTVPALVGTVWNSADKGANVVLSNSDLTVAQVGGTWQSVRAVAGKTSGKHYFELTITDITTSRYCMVGIAEESLAMSNYFSAYANGISYYALTGVAYTGNSAAAFGASFDDGDILGIAVDLDNQAVYFSKNGVWHASGDPESGASRTNVVNPQHYTDGTSTYHPAVATYGGTNNVTANFGDTAFTYTVPAGYAAGWAV